MTHYHVFISHPKWDGHYVCSVCGLAIPGRGIAAAVKGGAILKEKPHGK
jgi:hypothetical protein